MIINMIAMTNNEYLKDFVPNPLSFRMKALGFDEPCFGCYVEDNNDIVFSHRPKNFNDLNYVRTWRSSPNDDVCSAPTFNQSFRFFRDNYGMFHNVDKIFSDEFGYIITNEKDEPLNDFDFPLNDFDFNSWEEAELACLEKLLEIVESKS